MARNDDTSARDTQMPAYDDQGNEVNREDVSPEDRDTLGLNDLQDDEAL